MALLEANITVEHREISLKNRPKQLYSISSKGTVPVLHLSNDLVIDESLNIMSWIFLSKNSDFKLYDSNDLIDKNDNIFKNYLDKYKYYDRYPEKDQNYYRMFLNPFL